MNKKNIFNEFADYMVNYLKERDEYHPMMEEIRKNRGNHLRFVGDLYWLYLHDREKIPWYLENVRINGLN